MPLRGFRSPLKAKEAEKRMDQTITQWLNSPAGHTPVLDGIMLTVTSFGVPLMIVAVIGQWWSKADRLHVRHTCVSAGLTFLIGLGLNQILLWFVQRIRPYDVDITHLLVPPSADWSFPSDHATASLAIVAAFALHGLARRTILLGLMALLVCWSRIYVGTHYVSDVIGGGVTALLAALAVAIFYREGSKIDRFVTRVF